MSHGVPYSREAMDKVYALMADGKSLRAIGKMDGMPSAKSIQEWIIKYPDQEGELYARARDLQAEAIAGEMLEISDDSSGDLVTVEENGRTITRVDQENIQRSRLKVDTRKWLLSKLAPKKYGDRVEVEHSGTVNQVPIINVRVVPAKTEPPAIDVAPSKQALPPADPASTIACAETEKCK